MRRTIHPIATMFVKADRLDRWNIAGLDKVRAQHLLCMRHLDRRALETGAAYLLAGSKAGGKPQFPGATPSEQECCSLVSASRQCRAWRPDESPAFATIG